MPIEAGSIHPIQHLERHVDAHPVVRCARFEVIGQSQLEVAVGPGARKISVADAVAGDQQIFGEGQQVWL